MPKETMTRRCSFDIEIVDVHADLGSQVAFDFRRTLDELLDQGALKITVNLSQVKHINSAGIGALIGATRQLREKGGDLNIYGLSESLRKTFDLVGVSKILVAFESECEALAAF